MLRWAALATSVAPGELQVVFTILRCLWVESYATWQETAMWTNARRQSFVNSYNLGLQAGSAVRSCDSVPWSCEFEPHAGSRDYLNKLFKEMVIISSLSSGTFRFHALHWLQVRCTNRARRDQQPAPLSFTRQHERLSLNAAVPLGLKAKHKARQGHSWSGHTPGSQSYWHQPPGMGVRAARALCRLTLLSDAEERHLPEGKKWWKD